MFANRYTAFVDACALVGVLKRNILLTLAEAEFFRIRWSAKVLEETERGIEKYLTDAGAHDAADQARSQRARMEAAFQEASIVAYEEFECVCASLPDPGDIHVVAAALKTRASTIVTDNLADFPPIGFGAAEFGGENYRRVYRGHYCFGPGQSRCSDKKNARAFQKTGFDSRTVAFDDGSAGAH